MRLSPCVSCGKRKVKCDKEEPCNNCKRRKNQCVYAEDSTRERIKHLEAWVRQLGGDPDKPLDQDRTRAVSASDLVNGTDGSEQGRVLSEASISPLRSPDSEPTTRMDLDQPYEPNSDEVYNGSDSTIVQEQDDALYLETPLWRAWNGKYYGPLNSLQTKDVPADLLTIPRKSSVWRSIFTQQETAFQERLPAGRDAELLWSKYFQRVHPLMKLFFDWEITELRSKCIMGVELSHREYAFVFSIYLITIQSLPEATCITLGRSKKALSTDYQYLCEQALMAYDFFTAYDLITIQTLALYLYALFTLNNFAGMWDALGIVLRKAERLGLHRDGTFLKLSPLETEKRRRIWWSLQSLDLACNAMNGATSLNLMADWDTKLPLNIEDSDINSRMKEMPPERPGLTSNCHCLWRYWVIEEQRNFLGPDGKRLGMSWLVNRSISLEQRRTLVDSIETKVNERFIRFCDPIKPLDMTLLIIVRAVINWMRRATMLPGPAFKDAKDFTKEDKKALLHTSVQMLEYDRAVFVTPQLEPFQWHAKYLFPWSALVHVLVEIRNEQDCTEATSLWELVHNVYISSPEFERIDSDQRKIYTVNLTIEAWHHLQNLHRSAGLVAMAKPPFLSSLEEHLASMSQAQLGGKRRREPSLSDERLTRTRENEPVVSQYEVSAPWTLPINFEDIDWLFWSLPSDDQVIPGVETPMNDNSL